MAAPVLIDAAIVRGVLMPAAMALFGERNWYLPGWLARRLQRRDDRVSPAHSPGDRHRAPAEGAASPGAYQEVASANVRPTAPLLA
jgi:hypothetical protein